MFLKSLDIRGFKSFAEATHIEFTTGLNLIVGPNGCGKSNLVDAIRWVLGEQNVRNLRGQKLEDVIFAGTDQKRALSMASVSLTLDNTDQMLPSPYTEIMVNRRVYRSEQSEFYLNQQPVRLKDINQLFYGTGIGRKGYAIIGQGEIENLLSARPYDIRLVLEEASGLIRYRYQKEEAQERLRATDRDLQRLQDITGELANRLQELKLKAEKASLYLAVSSEQQALRTVLLKSEWGSLKRDIDQLKTTLAGHLVTAENCTQEVTGLETEHNRLFTDHQNLQQQLDEVKNQRYETANHLNQLAAQRTNIMDRIATGLLRSQELTEESAQIAQRVLALRAEMVAGSQKLKEENEILLTEKQRLQRALQEWQQIVTSQKEKGEHLEQLRRGLINKAQIAAGLRNQIKQASDEINQFTNRSQQFELEIEQRELFINTAEEQLARVNKTRQQGQEELIQVADGYDRVQEQLGGITLQREQLEKQLSNYRQLIVQAQHELQSLQTIENNYTGYSETVKKLLMLHKKQRDFMPGLLGVVGELMEVPTG
ncbi:MAG: chromosome segregation SMC family protein, partial [Methylocystaceae bacterium]